MGLLISLALAMVGGVAGALAFPHWNLWVLAMPSILLLLLALRLQSRSRHGMFRVVLIAIVWGLPFFGIQLTWAGISAGSAAPWVALTLLETAFICLFSIVWVSGERWLRHLPGAFGFPRLLWAPLAWVGVEQLRSLVPFQGFPWSKLAFAVVDSPLLAWAPWGGTAAVSGAVVLLAVAILEVFSWGRGLLLRLLSVVVIVAVLVFPQVVPPSFPVAKAEITVAAVQGNTPGREPQTAFGNPYDVLQNHVNESLKLRRESAETVDLVLWAENAADVDPRTDNKAASLLNQVNRTFQAPVLTGTLGAGSRGPGVPGIAPGTEIEASALQNTVLIWNQGKTLGTYSKTHLVPFGEYLPLRSFLQTIVPSFAALVPTDLVPGAQVAKLQVPLHGRDVTIASPICYEIADDDLVRQAAVGAAFIYVPTSNSFFGDSDQADQQLAIARFRAAEHGLDTVQVSTMDSTARIDAHGKVLGQVIPNFTAGSFLTSVPLREGSTPATQIGGILGLVSVVIFVLIAALQIMLSLKESWRRGPNRR